VKPTEGLLPPGGPSLAIVLPACQGGPVPTLLGHSAVPLAIGLGLGRPAVDRRLLAAGVVASLLPDLDVIGLRLGVSYGAVLGHRGLSHSLLAALLVGLAGAALARPLRARPGTAFLYLALAAASHPLLDALTDGGMGVMLLWPLSDERFFAPVRVIEVAPLGLRRFLSAHGVSVLWSELRWLWLPAAAVGLVLHGARRRWGTPAPEKRTLAG
jgi:inner membrane protein